MVTAEQNQLLTRIGPGTRMGDLMRRYWHPIAGAEEMRRQWTKQVRLLGEDLVLFKDRSGKLGLIGESCPHRRASLFYGIPTEDGIRCPYHGWKFDGAGVCQEMPNEQRHALLGKKITPAYPVEELGGLIFAYLGPQPAPLLPRLDGLVADPAIRHVGMAVVPCNWLQIMENSLDPVHVEWAHGALYNFLNEETGATVPFAKKHAKIGFDEFDYGLIKRRMWEGQTEESEDWKVGHPVVFPTMLSVGTGTGKEKGDPSKGQWSQYAYQYRVPQDDTHTLHIWYSAYVPTSDMQVPKALLDGAPVFDVPYLDEKGKFMLNYVYAQDIMAWVTQGPIADRSTENLGASDQGIQAYRRMLLRELAVAESGGDPKGVVRDPQQNQVIILPSEKGQLTKSSGFAATLARHAHSPSPIASEVIRLFSSLEQRSDKQLA